MCSAADRLYRVSGEVAACSGTDDPGSLTWLWALAQPAPQEPIASVSQQLSYRIR